MIALSLALLLDALRWLVAVWILLAVLGLVVMAWALWAARHIVVAPALWRRRCGWCRRERRTGKEARHDLTRLRRVRLSAHPQSGGPLVHALAVRLDLHVGEVHAILNRLEQAGLVPLTEDGARIREGVRP